MKFGTSILITLLSVVALVAELALYMFFGFGAALSGGEKAVSGVATFFVCLMVLTAVAGVTAPLSALVEIVTKKNNAGVFTFMSLLGITLLGLTGFAFKQQSGHTSPKPSSSSASILSSTQISPSATSTQVQSGEPQSNAEEDAYLSKVILKDVSVGKTVLEEDGAFGEIKNTGNRTLKKVEITVYALGADGNPVWDDTFNPVTDSQFAFGDSGHPLKPNYSRKFGYKVDAPSDWNKKVKVEVTKVEFADQSSQSPAPKSSTVEPTGVKTDEVDTPDSSSGSSESSFEGERYSQTRTSYLSDSDVADWNFDEVRYAINEMYARHGYSFKSKTIRKQFSTFPWYRPISGRSQTEA